MTLYKYLSKALFFENRLVRFTQPGALNDPHEALPELSIGRFTEEDYAVAQKKAALVGFQPATTRELEALFMKPIPSRRYDEVHFPALWPAKEPRLREKPFATIAEYDLAVAERAMELIATVADRSVGIFSLSRVLSEPMRAYYTDDHKGVVVGFDEKHSFFQGNLFEVEYSDVPFTVSNNDGWVRIFGQTISDNDVLEGNIKSVPLNFFLRKRSSWKHESEVRCIIPLKKASKIIRNRSDAHPICLFEIPSDAV